MPLFNKKKGIFFLDITRIGFIFFFIILYLIKPGNIPEKKALFLVKKGRFFLGYNQDWFLYFFFIMLYLIKPGNIPEKDAPFLVGAEGRA